MIKNAQTQNDNSSIQLTRMTRMLRRSKVALDGCAGISATYRDMEDWTGVDENTIKDWSNNRGRPTAEFLLELLDRIPEAARQQIFATAWRTFSTLEHPQIRCDQTVRSRLRSIVCRPNGLTFIQGGTDEARTFLLTALGDAFLSLTERPRRVAGFDAHQPDWFVPLPGIRYLANVFDPSLIAAAVRKGWPDVMAGRSRLILLNGIWSAVPALQKEIVALSGRFPVIIADAAPLKPGRRERRLKPGTNFITIGQDQTGGNGILVAIDAR